MGGASAAETLTAPALRGGRRGGRNFDGARTKGGPAAAETLTPLRSRRRKNLTLPTAAQEFDGARTLV